MSYLTIANIAENITMRRRVAACASEQDIVDAPTWAAINMLTLAAEPGWSAAWEYSLAANPGEDPGLNEGAITDGMILSAVQALRAEQVQVVYAETQQGVEFTPEPGETMPEEE